MNITFSTIDNGARNHGVPYIHAHADGIRVRFLERRDERYIGWRCDEHGDTECEHTDEAWSHLSRKIRDRIRHLLMVGA